MSDITDAIEQLLDKVEDYEKAEHYYDGDVEERFASERIRRVLARTGEDFRANFAAVPVDTVLNRLEIAGVTTTSDEGDKVIGKAFQDNDLMLEAQDVHKRALIYGDSYLTVWPDNGEIQVYYNSPINTIVLYEQKRPRQKRLAAKLWKVGEHPDRYQLNLYYPDRVVKYLSKSKSIKRDQDWIHQETVDNPFGRIPIFHFRTSRQYGDPEHKRAFGPQDAVNKLIITQMNTVDYQGAPQRYALAGNQQTNEITDFDEDETDRENLGSLQNGPGELWYLKGIDKVGQFNPADPKAFLEPLREYVRAMATLTQTPLHYFEPTGNVPSGESLRVAEAPLIKKVKDRQLSFGATWREVFTFLLSMNNLNDDVQVKWEKHESTDELTSWRIANEKKKAGLPDSQIFTEMGYDEELIREWTETRDESNENEAA